MDKVALTMTIQLTVHYDISFTLTGIFNLSAFSTYYDYFLKIKGFNQIKIYHLISKSTA